jgi:hypothetical protein
MAGAWYAPAIVHRVGSQPRGMMRRLHWATVVVLATSACGDSEARTPQSTAAPAPAASLAPKGGGMVDSVIPIPEALRRFKIGLAEVTTLSDDAPRTRDELVRRFALAVEGRDSVALARLAVNRAEFAYLYYPSSRYTRRPYELDPALLWFLTQQSSGKGYARLLRRLGGTPLTVVDHACAGQPTREGENVLWQGCTLSVRVGTDTVPRRLFGTVLERDGRFKLMSFANDF